MSINPNKKYINVNEYKFEWKKTSYLDLINQDNELKLIQICMIKLVTEIHQLNRLCLSFNLFLMLKVLTVNFPQNSDETLTRSTLAEA